MSTKKELCDKDMSFEECEMIVLQNAVKESENIQGAKLVNKEDTIKMLKIVTDFMFHKKLICYGGTAINNILPKSAQFYDTKHKIPDYDVYSDNALEHAKELANIFYKQGFTNIVAKSGVHFGTYKIYVNFIAILDITQMNDVIFKRLQKDAIKIAGIYYCPANFLRMNMFLELSRPMGDVSRWEKILQRLTLLNKHHPIISDTKCDSLEDKDIFENQELNDKINLLVRDVLIDVGVVFFGGFSTMLYSEFMSKKEADQVNKLRYFDVIHEDIEKCATIIQDILEDNKIHNVTISRKETIGELIPKHIIIAINKVPFVTIYEPIACHNYNVIALEGKDVNIATIDTILSFYLAFYYIDEPYYNHKHILCTAQYLFDAAYKNRVKSSGILKRFSTICYGKQKSLEDIRLEKYYNYEKLKKNKKSKEYEKWFLNYTPAAIENIITTVDDININKLGLEKHENERFVSIVPETKKERAAKRERAVKNKTVKKVHAVKKTHKKTPHTHKRHSNAPHLPFSVYKNTAAE